MNIYLVIATISLVFQLLVLSLLIVGFEFKRRLKFRFHGLTMAIALIIHLIVIVSIMIPSFALALIPIIFMKPTSSIGLVSPFHAAAGAITAILGIWIVAGWRFRQSTKFCAPKWRFMLITFVTWIISLSLGVMLYFALNWQFLFG